MPQRGIFYDYKKYELVKQIISDGNLSNPKDIGDYLKNMIKNDNMLNWYSKKL